MAKLGLSPDDTDQIYGISGTGGFYRRTDAPRFREMFDRHAEEMQAAVNADTTGSSFIADVFARSSPTMSMLYLAIFLTHWPRWT